MEYQDKSPGYPDFTKPIWRNAAKARRHEGRNDIAVEVAPGGHAVEQQYDRPTPWSLIEVMDPKPFPGMPMGSKVKILQPCKIVLGGSKTSAMVLSPYSSFAARISASRQRSAAGP